VTLFLTNPHKSNCRCRPWHVTFDRLHFSTFPLFHRHLKLSSKIRSSLLYFSTAITFERFKTFCLHSSRGDRNFHTRARFNSHRYTIKSYKKKIVTKCLTNILSRKDTINYTNFKKYTNDYALYKKNYEVSCSLSSSNLRFCIILEPIVASGALQTFISIVQLPWITEGRSISSLAGAFGEWV